MMTSDESKKIACGSCGMMLQEKTCPNYILHIKPVIAESISSNSPYEVQFIEPSLEARFTEEQL